MCHKLIIRICLIVSVAFLSGCGGRPRMEINRLDLLAHDVALGRIGDEEVGKMSGGIRALMAVTGADTAQSEAEFLRQYGATEFSEVFAPEVELKFNQLDIQEQDLGEARQILSEELPELKFPSQVYGIVTPYRQSVMTVDSVMLLGLNHYLGADFEGYEAFGAERSRKTPERMAVEAVAALVMSSYPFESHGGEATLLSRMLYDGAVTAAVKRALPGKSVKALLGTDSAATEKMISEEREIWRSLAEKGLLFSTDVSVNSRLFMYAQSSDRIYPGCPGRAVAYTAMRIVESYMKNNPDAKLPDLLSPTFYNSAETLRMAAYNP